jgi:predicted dehydrogenase
VVRGANSRIRLAVIGCGNRSARVFDSLARNADVEWLAGCEVNPAKLHAFMTPARQAFHLQVVTDYRRILDRKDIDAVLVGTPDFSHARITIDAIAAGKDVYVEKPAANTIPRLNAMLDAYNKSDRVVQIGAEQRSWDHFAEAKKVIDGGVLGNIRHVAIVQPGRYGGAGQEHVDVAHWFMNADHKVPRKTAAIGLFLNTENPDPEEVPDTFSISWEYDGFVMTFANGEVPRPQDGIEGWGTFFIGSNGSLQVNRMGYALRPPLPRTVRRNRPLPLPTAAEDGATVRNIYIHPRGGVETDAPLDAHVRNFLDCIKSRQKPNADLKVGYYSALPCLLALEAMRRNPRLAATDEPVHAIGRHQSAHKI